MNIITRRRLIVGIAVWVVLLLGLVIWRFFTEFGWNGSIDYSKKPSPEVFQSVTGKPIPPGVSNLRVAGHSYPGRWKHWVRMRFNATDEAIDKLVEGYDASTSAEAQFYIDLSMHLTGKTRYEESDMQEVGWDEVKSMAKPQVYNLYSMPPGSPAFVWATFVIPDKANHRAYIFALGD